VGRHGGEEHGFHGDEIDLATGKRLVWAAKTGSESLRAPTIAGGKVLIGTNNEVPRGKKYVGERGVLMCFDEISGEFLWQLVVPKLGSGSVQDWNQRSISSSALIHENRASVITNPCQVACLDMDGPFEDEAAYNLAKYQPPVELAKTDADIIWLFENAS
jgi:outer membrane protein assembly factor BamB